MPRLGIAIFVLLAYSHIASACSVPVFRYALEQWPASKYEVLVFHKGPLSSAEGKAVSELAQKFKSSNALLVQINLSDKIDGTHEAIWQREGKNETLPRVLLRYPESGPKIPSVWSGSLEEAAKPTLFDSPASHSLFERLTFGNAGAVLLLLSGDAKADDAARAMLRKELPEIAARIEPPKLTEEGPQVLSKVPLKIAFPLIEVARRPEEETFVRILLGSEDGLDKVKGPIAFPVFGRGRALCSLHGRDLQKPGELQRSLDFLCRACSCQVKELNPGVDLLITGRWETIFDAELGPKPHELIPPAETRPKSIGGPIRGEMRSPPPAGYKAVEVEEGSTRRPSWLFAGTAVAAIVCFASGVWVLRSRRPASPDLSQRS